MEFTYKINQKNNHCIISLQGNLLDKPSATGLLSDIDSLVADEKKSFVIDLSSLDHINSNGLNVLITILTKSRNAGGEVIVSNVPEKIKPLLVITKLHTVFTVVNNNKSAAGALKSVTGA